jgi:excisionase family DNA binding protein
VRPLLRLGAVVMTGVALNLDDDALDALADALADRIVARLEHRLRGGGDSGWMTTKQAAEHLGLSIHALHKLTAARAIPFTQDAPGARCYFKRADLDDWRHS